jgi:hypothetical protein
MRDRSCKTVVTVFWGRRELAVYGTYKPAEATLPGEEPVPAAFEIEKVIEGMHAIELRPMEASWLAADAVREVEGREDFC